ncbi:unnamed protein product [Urochloa decumbens]|uniref:DUF295 domain-containing protein n=1 Tax=Urochloa decumbens TaxID=240449 RepID=A0ABC9ER59_9POAL
MAEATPSAGQPLSWSDIPRDLAGLVLQLLPAYADRVRFATVCPQWRAAARQLALPPPLPLLALPDGTFYSLPYGKPFRFPVAKYADYEDDTRLPFPYNTWMHIKDQEETPTLNKLILCSPNLVAAFIGSGRTSQILMCQPGASSWSVRAYDECKKFEDMAFYQGKLYALDFDENLLIVNISQDPSTGDPQVSRTGQVIKGDPWYSVFYPDKTTEEMKVYLVETRDTLLMVRRKVWCKLDADGTLVALAGQNEFEVFEADLEHSRWVNVTTLGDDQVIFLGRWCSRAVSASQFGMSGDQIFFLDDVMENALEYLFDGENTSVGVYDMRTGEISSPLPMVWMHEMIPVTWLFPWD